MTPETAPCTKCREPVDVDSKTCPHCDHNPTRDAYTGPLILLMVGAVLTIFIITAIIGIPMIIAGAVWAINVHRNSPHPVVDINELDTA